LKLVTNFTEFNRFCEHTYDSRFPQSLGLVLNEETPEKNILNPFRASFGIATRDV